MASKASPRIEYLLLNFQVSYGSALRRCVEQCCSCIFSQFPNWENPNLPKLSPAESLWIMVQHLQGRTVLIWVSSSSPVLVRTMLGSGEWAVVVYERSGNKCLLRIHTFHYSSVKFVYKYYALKLPLLLQFPI